MTARFDSVVEPAVDDDVLAVESRETRGAATVVVPRASIQRERVVATNPDPLKRRRQQTKRGANNPKNVSPQDRLRAFPNEYLELRSSRLFCGACAEFLSTNLTTVRTHIKTKKTCCWQEATLKVCHKGSSDPRRIAESQSAALGGRNAARGRACLPG